MTYKTAYRWFVAGKIDGAFQNPESRNIFIKMSENENIEKAKGNKRTNRTILYAMVSSSSNKASLDGQIERMKSYATAQGYAVVDEIKEIASGLNEGRVKLNKVLLRKDYDTLIVEHKDRLARFGVPYIETILRLQGKTLEVINEVKEKDKMQELTEDFVAIVTSFCGRLYGQNRKKKTKEIIEAIEEGNQK